MYGKSLLKLMPIKGIQISMVIEIEAFDNAIKMLDSFIDEPLSNLM